MHAPHTAFIRRPEPVRPSDGRRVVTPADRVPPSASAAKARGAWVKACSARLAELRPGLERRESDLLAAELWREIDNFDPVIAAEMEFESGASPNGTG